MQLQHSVKNVFAQLNHSLEQLTPAQYVQPSTILFNASIGQHVRHIIELFTCLQKGYQTGIVNYENRKRDLRLETDKEFALNQLVEISRSLDLPDKTLLLEANYDEHCEDTLLIGSNYYREILYNLEHTIHHMALIRVGIQDVSTLVLPEGFGVAASTIKYRKTCAQ